MPELPDVEGFRRYVARHAEDKRVRAVTAADPDSVRNTSPQGLGRALAGRRVGKPGRHGKWLLLPMGGPVLVWHFGMTGEPVWAAPDEPAHEHDRVVLRCAGGDLRLRMMRRLGGVWLVREGEDVEVATGPLGPDALHIDRDDLRARLGRRRGGLKSALMDQRVLAGLGNLLVDELLWRARLHPRTPARSLDDDAVARLHERMGQVLGDAIPTGRVPPEEDWLTGARDRPDPDCPRCGASLRHAQVAGRSTWWCPDCQPAP